MNLSGDYIMVIDSMCIAKAVEQYIELWSNPSRRDEVDKHLATIVDRMFAKCFADKEYKQASSMYIHWI
jgi:hypothetical protein